MHVTVYESITQTDDAHGCVQRDLYTHEAVSRAPPLKGLIILGWPILAIHTPKLLWPRTVRQL